MLCGYAQRRTPLWLWHPQLGLVVFVRAGELTTHHIRLVHDELMIVRVADALWWWV